MEEDRINMDETMQVDSKLLKLAEEWASLDRKSKDINDAKKEITSNVEKLGEDRAAFRNVVTAVKRRTPEERDAYLASFARINAAIGERQAELFPEEVEKRKRRAEREAAREAARQAKEGRSKEELDEATEANPRSDPESGGAGKKRGRKKSGDNVVPLHPGAATKQAGAESDAALAEAIAATQATEQEQGEALLSGVVPESGVLPN